MVEMTNTQLSNVRESIVNLDKHLQESISSKKISPTLVNEFDSLSEEFQKLGDYFYKKFSRNMIDQIITFGTCTTTNQICKNIQESLVIGIAAKQNPIAAERIVEGSYLMLINSIAKSLEEIDSRNRVEDDSFTEMNQTVRMLVRASQRDSIYKEGISKFTTPNSEKIASDLLVQTNQLMEKM